MILNIFERAVVGQLLQQRLNLIFRCIHCSLQVHSPTVKPSQWKRKPNKTKSRQDRSSGAADVLQVTIENLDPIQLRRIHELELPLPLRPGNRACAFLAACGIDATAVGTTVDLDRLAGVIVGMRFRGLDANGAEGFDFEPVPTVAPAAARGPSGERLAEKTSATGRDLDGRREDSQ